MNKNYIRSIQNTKHKTQNRDSLNTKYCVGVSKKYTENEILNAR